MEDRTFEEKTEAGGGFGSLCSGEVDAKAQRHYSENNV
jgi:hypothetical protein